MSARWRRGNDAQAISVSGCILHLVQAGQVSLGQVQVDEVRVRTVGAVGGATRGMDGDGAY